MARLRQALLYCLHNVGIWCKTGSGCFLSELMFQIRSNLNSNDHECISLGYAPWPGTFYNTVTCLARMMKRRIWTHSAYSAPLRRHLFTS